VNCNVVNQSTEQRTKTTWCHTYWGCMSFSRSSLPCRLDTPSSLSIISSSRVWSLAWIGAIEMSLTARNWPQLFKCSFSSRKKFHTNLLEGVWIRTKMLTFVVQFV